MSEKSARCGPACTRRNSSAGFGARGRCEASTGLGGVLVVRRLFPCYDVSLVCVRGQIAYLANRSCSTLGRMSSTSSHSKSRSVVISTHRPRVLDRPSRDSGSITIVLSSRGVAPTDPRIADALVTMWSFFNVDLVVTTHRLTEARKNHFVPPEYELHAPLLGEHPYDVFPSGFSLSTAALEAGLRFPLHPVIEACLERFRVSEMFNLGKMKSSDGTSSRLTVPSAIGASTSVAVARSTAKKRSSVDEGSSLRKCSRRGTSEQLAVTLESTTRVPVKKGKEPMETEEALERGYTFHKLCEVEDHVGAEKYFATIMMQLKAAKGEDPLVPRWSAISRSSQVWTEGPLAREYLRGLYTPSW
ncbi:hypothetical protein BHM03_00047200 [Ensete ventricosum]|uniref:Uncharacterized protein n=1 Tax=Ensete ventricosum TaxID=4639 RepID=A0A445ML99_ENSVE|nr:hypothetical protein BHM03_00047200 [Ensete ventricosum]